MNIKNRLKRLTASFTNESSAFCDCNENQQQIEMRRIKTKYDAYATGRYVPYQDSETAKEFDRQTESETTAIENCKGCGKPINKRVIILNLVGR